MTSLKYVELLTTALCCVVLWSLADALLNQKYSELNGLRQRSETEQNIFIRTLLRRNRREIPSKDPVYSEKFVTSKFNRSTLPYAWSPWQPSVQVTCPGQNKDLNIEYKACSRAHARLRQTRKCERKASENGEEPVGNCGGSDSTREILCGSADICKTWSAWSKFHRCESKEKCNHPSQLVGVYYRYKQRICDSAIPVSSSCTMVIQNYISPRANNPGVDTLDPGLPQPPPNDPGQQFSTTTKVIVFSVAGVVMVALLGYAGARLSKTVTLGSRPRTHGRTISSSVEANDIQYTSINHATTDANSNLTPRLLVVNQNQSLPGRRPGRRMAHPNSNLSIIREEETDDVFEEESQADSDVSYDELSVDSQSQERKQCDDALDFMDEVISEIQDTDDAFTNTDDIPNGVHSLSTSEYRQTGDPGILSEYGWSPKDRLKTPATIEKLKDSEDQALLSASALSLASASLLVPGVSSEGNHHHMSSSMTSTCITEDVSSECGSLRSTSSLKEPRRIPSRFVALKHFSSMPDMTKAASTIPDVDEVLAGSLEWREYC